ncbi:hypothetical protein [Embleya sp. NBC_00896]|uniref:hypothetical protein n=1 Tax=Embleya sp. NBC_00896 TaxID=2975961 RepID=UPI0038662D9F|nr:hypothetical protein OG928_17445 [Embleya sp. NBC_00896]
MSVPLRAVRAAVFAAVCAALAACGHAWMSTEPLPLWAPAAGFGAVFVAAFAGAGRQRSLGSITALLAVGQLGLHTLFSWAAAAAVPAASGASGSSGAGGLIDRFLCGPRDSAGHILLPAGWSPEEIVRNARVDPTRFAQNAPSGHHHLHGSGPMLFDGGAGMLCAHLAAAGLTGWWLRRGEAALFALIALAAAPLRVVLAVLYGPVPVVETPGGVRRTGAEPDLTTHQTLLRHAVTRRGPPAEYALAC